MKNFDSLLNAAADSARYSHDFDIFHEVAGEVTRASNRDVDALRHAGFQVETPSRYGEWEKEATFRKARVIRGGDASFHLCGCVRENAAKLRGVAATPKLAHSRL